MFKKFQILVNTILENMNSAGAGGAFGTPQQASYNPPANVNSGDSIATGDGRNIFGGYLPLETKNKKKSKKKNKKPLMIRRKLSRKDM
jgi:hypothetical protein